jgi:1,4-dihydroxy-2-naphthoate octaprenyltransferase
MVGHTTTVILFCSHFHQIEGDIRGGKMSPLVRLGTARACRVLRAAAAAPYAFAVAGSLAGLLPLAAVLATAVSLPAALSMIRFAEAHHEVPARVAKLKQFATKWHVAFCLALVAGLLLS